MDIERWRYLLEHGWRQRVSRRRNNAMTLSCVNVAGVSTQSNGPALSLNTGDNDGFYSMDGGASWSYQQYGGGDNDCSFADPLRSNSMLVFTPRWNQTVSIYETSPGSLPNAAATGTSTRYNVPGPTTPNVWNANSAYGNRGSRPIVHGLRGRLRRPRAITFSSEHERSWYARKTSRTSRAATNG